MNYRYQCLGEYQFDHQQYSATALRKQDIYLIKQWRNDQIDVLRQQDKLTDEDQVRYFHNVVTPTFDQVQPKIILFSFLLNEHCIGYGGLTNIDWASARAELSFLLDTARAADQAIYKHDFAAFLTLMKQVTFGALHFNRLFTETFDIRPLHISILEANGFAFEGRMRQHVRIGESYVDSLLHGCLKEYDDAQG